MPSVIGSTRADAEAELRGPTSFPSSRTYAARTTTPSARRVKQNPLGTTEVAPQTVVTVEINVGPATAKIPNGLVGEDVDKVTKELEEAGFTSIQTEPVDDPGGDADKDEVLSIDPEEGESVALDEDIVIRFARDKDDDESRPRRPGADRHQRADAAHRSPRRLRTKRPRNRPVPPKPTPKPTKTSASEAPTETPGAGEGRSAGEGPSEGEQ